jgi:hypothetical protein
MSYTNPPNVTNNPPNVIGMAGSKKGETETANALIYLACSWVMKRTQDRHLNIKIYNTYSRVLPTFTVLLWGRQSKWFSFIYNTCSSQFKECNKTRQWHRDACSSNLFSIDAPFITGLFLVINWKCCLYWTFVTASIAPHAHHLSSSPVSCQSQHHNMLRY